MNQVLPATRSAGLPAALAPEVASLTIDDSEYVLNVYVCPHCGQPHYRLCRFAGAFYSSYIPPDDFQPEDFEDFARTIHETMSIDAKAILQGVRGLLRECNTPHGIQTDGSYLSQLQDFA
jgi:hypothetical protein